MVSLSVFGADEELPTGEALARPLLYQTELRGYPWIAATGIEPVPQENRRTPTRAELQNTRRMKDRRPDDLAGNRPAATRRRRKEADE
jgi:hypothetical protein